MGLTIRQNLNLIGEALDPFIQPQPILIKPDDDVMHPFRDLITPQIQDREQRLAKRMSTGTNRDALFDQEGPDLVYCCGPPRNQPRSNPMQGLQIKLILGFLANGSEVRSERCLGNGFGIVIVILLALQERLHVDRRDNPWLEAKLAEGAAHEMRAHAGFHPNDTARKLLKCRH